MPDSSRKFEQNKCLQLFLILFIRAKEKKNLGKLWEKAGLLNITRNKGIILPMTDVNALDCNCNYN